jgi:hypothetical protein
MPYLYVYALLVRICGKIRINRDFPANAFYILHSLSLMTFLIHFLLQLKRLVSFSFAALLVRACGKVQINRHFLVNVFHILQSLSLMNSWRVKFSATISTAA